MSDGSETSVGALSGLLRFSIRANYYLTFIGLFKYGERQALLAFGAMSQETRLRIVRLLVRAGPDGMAAGRSGEAVGVSPSNVPSHLRELERGGLATARRASRSIVYTA